MALCGIKKQNEQVCAEPKHLSSTEEERGNAIKPDCSNEFRVKVAKAIEVNSLCYDCKTGFHYMKQT